MSYFSTAETQSPTQDQSKRQSWLHWKTGRRGSAPEGRESDGRMLVEVLPWPLHVSLNRIPLAYGFAVELRNLLHRMAIRYERRYEAYGLDFGPSFQKASHGGLEPCTRTRACIRDTKRFAMLHPTASMVDLETYRDAWVAGAAWGKDVHVGDSCKATHSDPLLASDVEPIIPESDLAPDSVLRHFRAAGGGQ